MTAYCPDRFVSIVKKLLVGLGYIDSPVWMFELILVVPHSPLQSVSKQTFGLPVVSILTPSGGKGSSQTQTSLSVDISLIINEVKAVFLETSRPVNWIFQQYSVFKT